MIDSDRAIPPLHDDAAAASDFPRVLKHQLVARITAQYRLYAAVQTDNSEDNDGSMEVLEESVRPAGAEDLSAVLDPLDDAAGLSPATVGYRQSEEQAKLESTHMYRALKRRMRAVKKQRDSLLEGSAERTRCANELRDLTKQYKAYHSAKMLEEATSIALGASTLLDEAAIRNAVVATPLLRRLRRSDHQALQPHLNGISSNEFASRLLQQRRRSGSGALTSKTAAFVRAARQDVELLQFVAGLQTSCEQITRCLLTFFSFHDMLYNVESEALKTHQEALEFVVRHPQGLSEEERRSNVDKLQTVEFYQRLVVSQNYQLFKEERLQGDDRAHALTTQFRRQSRRLLIQIIEDPPPVD